MDGINTSGSILLTTLFLIAGIYLGYYHTQNKNNLTSVLNGLLESESSANIAPNLRVAIGFGSCVDIIGPAIEIFESVGIHPINKPEHFNVINTKEDIEKMFAYFFQHGAAAERYTSNDTYFHKLVDHAKLLNTTKIVLGGNAPVMVKSFKKFGFDVLLGAQMSPYLRQLLDDSIQIAGKKVSTDDIHLILEYQKDEIWGKYRSPRANRFIIHNDANNPLLSPLESFAETLPNFNPHLIIIAGLQMMDNFPYANGERKARLQSLSSTLATIPQSTRIHFEMASFVEEQCLRDVINNVILRSDSIGMNEQELPNLLSIVLNGTITYVSDPQPRIATSLDQMRHLYAKLRHTQFSLGLFDHLLTRLHVHTLAFQAIMVQTGSQWKNVASAAATAALTANRHTCGSKEVKPELSRLLMDDSFTSSHLEGGQRITLDPHAPVSCWIEPEPISSEYKGVQGSINICLAPVLACTHVVQTVGGGDNISSAGLVYQI